MTGTEWQDRVDADEAAAGEEGAASAAVSVEALAERLAAADAEAGRLKNEYLRALADAENVRKRAARDRQEAGQYAIAGFARDLLSVADNLQRALASVDAQAKAADPALQALTSGVEMTEKELLSVLERHGVKQIPALGEVFDPHVHEALYEVPDRRSRMARSSRWRRPATPSTTAPCGRPGSVSPAAARSRERRQPPRRRCLRTIISCASRPLVPVSTRRTEEGAVRRGGCKSSR